MALQTPRGGGSCISEAVQGTYALRQGQDKVLRRIGAVFQERIPDESNLPLRLPGDPSAAPITPKANAKPAPKPVNGAAIAPAAAEEAEEEAEQQPRVKGPAMPSEALRQAAAGAAAAMRSQGLLDNIMEGVSGELVGPVPADVIAEADSAAANDREAQVERVLAVLAKHKRSGVARHGCSCQAQALRMRGSATLL